MASHLVSHENLEPAGASTKAEALKANAADCSVTSGRLPLQKVPSNLEITHPGSEREDLRCAVMNGTANMPGQVDPGVPDGVALVAGGAENAVSPTEHNVSTADVMDDSVNRVLSDGNIAEERETVPSVAGEAARQGLGKAGRVLYSSDGETEDGVQSEMPKRALQSGARRVASGAGEELEVGEDGAEAKQEKQPLAWFPRAKKDSFLERKIKKMQVRGSPFMQLLLLLRLARGYRMLPWSDSGKQNGEDVCQRHQGEGVCHRQCRVEPKGTSVWFRPLGSTRTWRPCWALASWQILSHLADQTPQVLSSGAYTGIRLL